MKIRPDLLILAVILAGSTYAVATQMGADPVGAAEEVRTLPIGGVVDDMPLHDWDGIPRRLLEWKGEKATVFYFWSIDCPCVPACQMRMQTIMDRFRNDGISFVAIDSAVEDKGPEVFAHAAKIRAMYRMLLDPSGRAARRLGGATSTDVVVIDANRRIRYRGAIDDALKAPKTPYLMPVLEAIVAGKEPPFRETTPYGCPFPWSDAVCELR